MPSFAAPKLWTCECGELWFLCTRHGKPLAKIARQVRSTQPKPRFMDDATERKLLARLDNRKCTPKYSQATALGARRSLRAMLGVKAGKAIVTTRGSTATFGFRNRRRTKANFVAVEGLVAREAKDIHVKKPRAKDKVQQ